MAITPSRSRAVFREYACYCWLCWCFSIHRSTLIMMIDSPHATITVWNLEKLSRSSRQTDRQGIDNGFAIHSCSGLVRLSTTRRYAVAGHSSWTALCPLYADRRAPTSYSYRQTCHEASARHTGQSQKRDGAASEFCQLWLFVEWPWGEARGER